MKREVTAESEVDVLSSKWNAPEITGPEVVSATELFTGEIKRLRAILAGILWLGLTLLIAKPKAGKSWLALAWAVHIAGGEPMDGVSALEHGPVLYFALEEPPARTADRIRKIASNGEWAKNLHFVYELLPLMGGGVEQIEVLITTHKPIAVVIDTLTGALKGGSKRENDVFRSQYAEVSRLRKIAEDHGIALVVVHHTRKGVSDGVVEAVAGTGGIAAAVDTLALLKRKPEGEATLEIVGRECEEKTLALRFGQDPFGWQVLGDDSAQALNSERRELLALLRDEGALTPAEIAVNLGKARPAVRMLLKRMREDGHVQKQGSKYIPSLSMSYRVTERE